MSKFPYRQDREELKALLQQYENLQTGLPNSFIEEDGFERLIEYFEEKEQYKKGLEASEYALSQYPYSASLLFIKANLLIILRHYQEALDVLEQAEVFNSQDTTLYILKTDAYLALDEQEKAAELLEAAIDIFDGDEKLDLLFELADVYDDYENFEKVFDCFCLILSLDPNNEEALYKICFWTDFTGRNEESIKLHQRILDDYPFNELAWFNLGAAYQGIKLYEKAIDAYKYAVAIDEKFDYAFRNMGDAYIRLRKYKEAIEMLEKVAELSRPEAVIYEAIGHCYDKLSNFPQARFYYKKASHLNAEDGQLFYKIACTYMNEGAWQAAIKQLHTASKMHRMQPEYNLALGQCYMQLNNIDEAITYFGTVVRIRPKNITGWQELLKCLLSGKLYEEGVEYASFAYEQTDQKPIFLYYKSMFLLAGGKLKEGTLVLETAMDANPKLIKKFIELNPAILQQQPVVEVIARHKKKNKLK
ncbi:MAG: tetratricopeptide repeat protein [Chitinophagaceae bacterium]|nr:MAG: tetratricopeptide repeat protein [Chitinophagaceae bacterium]